MGFLHKLWDETLAGPTPEAGLGKLRKYDSFSSSPSSLFANSLQPATFIGSGAAPPAITRTIMIARSNRRINYNSPSTGAENSPNSCNSPMMIDSPTPSTPGTPPARNHLVGGEGGGRAK
ncbi:Dormancy-associated protein homolog 4 [Linum perenne]